MGTRDDVYQRDYDVDVVSDVVSAAILGSANGRFKEEDCNNRAQSLSIRALGGIATILAIVFIALIFFG